MKAISLLLLLAVLCWSAAAQNKTIVLVRHAEKAGETAMDKTGDPDLSPGGQERAKRLVELVKKYKPHEIYATAYKRVQQTVQPVAEYRHKQIQIYDPAKQAELVNHLLNSKTEHFLIAGHSNTIPQLANLLAKKDLFKQMSDNEFGIIWVIKIRNGELKRVEVYAY
jgi:2,3-bisphosphoglycerate-dependent phosphoglycerate mutase